MTQQKHYHQKEHEDLLRDFHTDLSVGDILQRARERLNLTVDQCAIETKIQKNFLKSIEAGKLDQLPGRVYAIGFIKTYAEYLGLDGEKIIQLLKKQSGQRVKPKPLATTMPVDEDHSVPTTKTLFIVLALLVGGLVLYSLSNSGNSNDQEIIPPVSEELKNQVTLSSKPDRSSSNDLTLASINNQVDDTAHNKLIDNDSEAVEAKGEVQSAKQIKHSIGLKALDTVWLEIKTSDGRVMLSRVLSTGEEYWLPSDSINATLTMGNAAGLQIIIDGEMLPILGKKAQVIRNFSLNAEYLKDLLKKN